MFTGRNRQITLCQAIGLARKIIYMERCFQATLQEDQMDQYLISVMREVYAMWFLKATIGTDE